MTKFDRPLRVEFLPSARLAVAAGLAHGVAAVAVAFAPLQPALRFMLWVWVVAHFVRFIRHQITMKSRRAVRAVAWDRARGWRLADVGGEWCSARPVWPVFVSYYLVVARFRVSLFKTRTVVISADRLAEDTFRRLRVRLIQSAHVHRG